MAQCCLVLNLTRFGDLLQTQPLLHDLKAKGFKTGLVCLDTFAGAIPLLSDLDASFVLKGARLLRLLDEDWVSALYELRSFVEQVKETFAYDVVVNLTATLSARLLAKLLTPESTTLLGFGIDSEGFGVQHGSWSTFLVASTLQRTNAVFHLSDMFRAVAALILTGSGQALNPLPKGHMLSLPENAESAHFFTFLAATIPPAIASQIKGYVGFQLGASEPRRQWPTQSFAELGDFFWQELNFLPVLTGTKNERALGEAYATLTHAPFLDAIGKTSLPDLAHLLTHLRLLISNDTGTLHLAAGLGTTAIGIYLATAQPFDTAPLMPGSLCLEADLPCHPCAFGTTCPHSLRCHETIKAPFVFSLAKAYFEQATWPESQKDCGVRIWQTCRDRRGFADLLPLSGQANAPRTLWMRHQRLFWRQLLGALESGSSAQETLADQELAPLPVALLQEVLDDLEQTTRILALLLEQAPLLGRSPTAGKLFLRNSDRIHTILKTNPKLVAFGNFWHELRQDASQHIDELVRKIRLFHDHLVRFSENLKTGTENA